jgi:hypothetical protein
MAKVREHNEHFRMVTRPKCPTCGRKAQVWTWGQYVRGKWNNVQQFCEHCFPCIAAQLRQHAEPCGCTFNLISYGGGTLPTWLSLDNTQACEL